MNENIKKGISLVAFGFLFILVNFNLTINGTAINITPDCIGWALLFFAHDHLSAYLENQQYLKWTALVQVILSGALWVLSIAKPEIDAAVLHSAVNVIGAVYMFILFGKLELIAIDYGSSTAGTISFLRWVNAIVYAALAVAGLILKPTVETQTVVTLVILGVIAIVAAIVTMFTLFRLRKDLNETI